MPPGCCTIRNISYLQGSAYLVMALAGGAACRRTAPWHPHGPFQGAAGLGEDDRWLGRRRHMVVMVVGVTMLGRGRSLLAAGVGVAQGEVSWGSTSTRGVLGAAGREAGHC